MFSSAADIDRRDSLITRRPIVHLLKQNVVQRMAFSLFYAQVEILRLAPPGARLVEPMTK
jgi:hypothetical protein